MLEPILQARRRALIGVHFFDISFQSRGDGTQTLLATDSRGRQARGEWLSPFTDNEISALIEDPRPWHFGAYSTPEPESLRDLSVPPAEAQEGAPGLEELGRELFDSLFIEGIRRLYSEDVGYRDPDESLCIVLTFDPTDSEQMHLFALPWESLHGGRDFLGLSRRPIIRRLRSDAGEALEPLFTRKLRILAVPLDDAGLDLKAEQLLLSDVQHRGGAFELEIAPIGLSLVDMRRRLEEGGFHVLHLMGHGHWSAADQAWGVEFAGGFITAATLARQLRGELTQVRLVVLNTCHSARALDPETVLATGGLASSLVAEGALAVLANGAPITDAAARTLTYGLYHRLASGWPLPHATTAARLDMDEKAPGNHSIRPGEWTTPRLHLRFPGRLFIVRPRRWPVTTWMTLAASITGFFTLAATAGVWLAHPMELALISVPLAGVLWRLIWGWTRHVFSETHPLSSIADTFASKRRQAAVAAGLLLVTGLLAWTLLGVGRLKKLPCLRKAPDIDWTRGVLVEFSPTDRAHDGWDRHWLNDLEKALEDKSLIPLKSELGQSVPRTCFSATIIGRAERMESGAVTHLYVESRGRESRVSEPGAPVDLQDLLSEHVLTFLGGDEPRQLLDDLPPESREANAQAILNYRRGDFGRAQRLLEDAVERDPDTALLRGNLAQVLFDMARQVHLLRRSDDAGRGEREERKLLSKAVRHLSEAIRLEPESAAHHFHRGRIHQRLAEDFGEGLARAEADLRTALAKRPLFPEASNDLAVLLLDRGGRDATNEAKRQLERALLVVDAADRATKAAILKNLGRVHHLEGDLAASWEAYEKAECLAPATRRDLKAEARGRAAELLGDLLGPASADVAWWRYGELLPADPDSARREAFFTWRGTYPHKPSRKHFRLWSLRCDRGDLAALS